MSVTLNYRCTPCNVFAEHAGDCPFCDVRMEPLRELGVASEQPAAPCPDWPDEDRGAQRERRSGRRAPAPRERTRAAA